MDILHLSLLGKTKFKSLNGNWMHLAHAATSDYHLMAFIDGYGKGFIRNGDEIKQVNPDPEDESDISASETAPETYLLCRVATNGFRAGALSSAQLCELYENAKAFFYPRFAESEAEKMKLERLFHSAGLALKTDENSGRVVLDDFTDIEVVYWYEKSAR